MGSRTKLVLASTMAIAMVLAFAVGFWPSPSNVGANAAVDGKLNVASLLNGLLNIEKQATASITFPPNGTTIKIPASATEANLSVKVSSMAQSVAVASGGYSLSPNELSWGFGTLYGIDNAAPFEAKVNLANLAEGSNTVTAYTNPSLVAGQTAQFFYETRTSTSFNLQKLAVNPDSDGNGLPDNPFSTVGPGEVWVSKNAQGATVMVVNLGAVAKVNGTLDPVTIDNVTVTPPSLAALQAADAGASQLSNATQALLVFEAAPDLATLLGDPTWAQNVTDSLPPNALIPVSATLNQYAEISIVYEYNGGLNFDEVDELPAGTSVGLEWSNLTAEDNSSAIFFSVDTTIDNSYAFQEVPGAGWTKKNDATTVTAGLAAAQLDTLSLFAPFASAFKVYNVVPDSGPMAGGNAVSVDGSYPIDAAITTVAAANAAYAVYFGDPYDASTRATLAVNTSTGNVATADSFYVTAPAGPGGLASALVDVYVVDANDVNDFGVLQSGYTYAPQPGLSGVSPAVGSTAGGDTVTLSGVALLTAQAVYFGGDLATINVVTDASVVVTTPAHAAGLVSVTVVTAGGQDTLANAFEYGATPVTDFSANTTVAVPNSPVQFTDLSTNSPTSWAWDFNNDGIVDSTEQNPAFAYTTSGTYTVALTATNQFGSDTATKLDYITVLTSVIAANFTADTTSGDAPLTVHFTDTTSGGPTVWAWNFGDGGTSTEQNPTYIYQDPGTYTVSLTASNALGSDTKTVTDYITVTTPVLYVSNVTPNNAWAFGGVVARIDGQGFNTASLGGDVTVSFGGVDAPVLQATDSELYVNVPPQVVAGASSVVDVTVSRTNGATTSFTRYNAFTYVHYEGRNENNDGGAFAAVTTTAATLAGGTGTVNVVLDANNPGTVATLNLPAALTKQGGNLYVLARASKSAQVFGLDSLTTGNAINDVWNFDLHVYTGSTTTGTLTPGVQTYTELSTAYTRDDATTPATLTFPTGTTDLVATDMTDGIVGMFSLDTDLAYGLPYDAFNDANFSVTGLETYQSQPYTGEYTLSGTDVTQVTSRLYSLSAFALRTDVSIDLEALGPQVVVGGQFTNEGPLRGGTPVAIEADGGLGYIDHIAFMEPGTGKQLGTADAVITTPVGTDEFRVQMTSPRFSKAGPVDVAIYLKDDPNTPAAVLQNAFTYTGTPIPWPVILAALFGFLGIAAGGDHGGGGGGPCFIATAAYGTPMADQIDTLRAVRDTYLLNNAVGSALVDTYYRVSPAIADVVAKSPVLAAAVRLALMPVILLSKMVLAMPHVSALLALLAMVPFLRRRSRKA